MRAAKTRRIFDAAQTFYDPFSIKTASPIEAARKEKNKKAENFASHDSVK